MTDNEILYKVKILEASVLRSLNLKSYNKTVPTHTQMQILNYIIKHENEDIYQKDLEKVLNLRRATVSGVLKTMEKNNFIKRIVNDNDTRTKKIIMNSKVKEIFLQTKDKIEKIQLQLIKNIDEEDLLIFLKVLTKMQDNINLFNMKGEK